jgi:CheY-like chemotaxis protein
MSNPSQAPAEQKLAKNRFLANVRHELRTPLNAIIGYSEMLLEDAVDSRSDDAALLQRVQSGGRSLLDLVNTLLDPARIGNDFETHAPGLCQQMCEPVAALIANVDTLVAHSQEGHPDWLDDLAKIGEAARRLQGQVNDILGVAQHAARHETTATFPPERLSPGVQDYVDFMSPEQRGPVRRPDRDQGRILVVDDNEMNRDVLSRRLQREGHTVKVAASGPEALELLYHEPFDVVLLDIIMPGMNGLQVLEQLKVDPQLRHLPVVMISALDEMDSVVRSIEIGAEDYLPKPFEPAILRARVGACLEKKRLRDREVQHLQQIEAEKKRADELLHVILPAEVVVELKATNAVKPKRFDNVAVMFCDIVGFTPYCDKREPEEVVANLQHLIVAFEEFAVEHKILKIKTIGDAFMAACGLLEPVENPVLNCLRCGVKMIAHAKLSPAHWEVRMGVHMGSVVAGVLGHRQYLFDLWGDTVNTAARMESHGLPSAITLSEAAHARVAHCCECESRGTIHVKGKGEQQMYVFRKFREPEPAADS